MSTRGWTCGQETPRKRESVQESDEEILARALAESARLAGIIVDTSTPRISGAAAEAIGSSNTQAQNGSTSQNDFPSLPASVRRRNQQIDDDDAVQAETKDEANLRRALEESARFVPSEADGEDSALKRALEESKIDLVEEQKKMLDSFERQQALENAAAERARKQRERMEQALRETGEVATRSVLRGNRRRHSPVAAVEVLGFYSARPEEPPAGSGPSSCTGRGLGGYRSGYPRGYCNGYRGGRPDRARGRGGCQGGRRFGFEAQTFSPYLPKYAPLNLDTATAVSENGVDLSVIIDGQSIGEAHGIDKWSADGLKIAVDYFQNRGHTVLVMLPAHIEEGASHEDRAILIRIKEQDQNLLYIQQDRGTARAETLEHAVDAAEEGTRVMLVSNYQFNHELNALHNPEHLKSCRTFLTHYRISFAFVGDAFQPQAMPSRLGI
jgi:Zc3h12a-like Ribonuclease NYN domain